MEVDFKKLGAEFLGTFALVFFGCGAAIMTRADVITTALAFGLVVVAMAYALGAISGCHLNPAVSVGMLIAKKISVKDFLLYVCAQMVGALAGYVVLVLILRMAFTTSEFNIIYSISGVNGLINGENAGSYFASIALEVVLTFFFVFTILMVTSKKENAKIAGLVIGLTLTLVHIIGINLTGTSVNPARSFGAAIGNLFFDGKFEVGAFFVFLLAPLAGGALAALVHKVLNPVKE